MANRELITVGHLHVQVPTGLPTSYGRYGNTYATYTDDGEPVSLRVIRLGSDGCKPTVDVQRVTTSPYVQRVYAITPNPGSTCWMVMEPYDISLAQMALPLPEHLVISIIRQLAQGLRALSPACHPDLKPSNVVMRGFVPKITDFEPDTDARNSCDSYMAPEVRETCTDIRSNVWSLGIMMYEMIVGYVLTTMTPQQVQAAPNMSAQARKMVSDMIKYEPRDRTLPSCAPKYHQR